MEIDNYNIITNEYMLETLDDYHFKSLEMQKYYFENNSDNITLDELKTKINDDLIFNVPIYDMLDRRYAAFSSLLEALNKKDKDPKGNGIYFKHVDTLDIENNFILYYLFRLCGSGINYVPKNDNFLYTHGFGNFWIVDLLLDNITENEKWYNELKNINKPFTNNSGYMLPQFTFDGVKQHLKHFILTFSKELVHKILEFTLKEKREIYQVVDYGNTILKSMGFNRQNFVLTAFAMDIAEYYPNLVDPMSKIYTGTNATKCLKTIFKKKKKINDFDFLNECCDFLAKRYNSTPYSVEDSRACDVIRYIQEFQSPAHISKNNNIIYKNNSILKSLIGNDKYYDLANNIK